MNLPKKKAGYVYILENSLAENVIKIGITEDMDTRVKSLSNHTSSFGDMKMIWRFYTQDCKSLERALHYKFREFWINKEYFKIRPSIAVKHADQVAAALNPLKNKNVKLLKQAATNEDTLVSKHAKKMLWREIAKENQTDFIKQAIKLCLSEKKSGQPQYERFSAIRSAKFTGIGRFDLYVCANHLRIGVTTDKVGTARAIIKKRFGNRIDLTPWGKEQKLKGLNFYIRTKTQFSIFKAWTKLGIAQTKKGKSK